MAPLCRTICLNLSLLIGTCYSLQLIINPSKSLRNERCVAGYSGISTALHINFGWFSGKDESQKQQGNDENSVLSKDGKGSLGGVAGVMDSMERYKKAQRIGKMTASLVQDLSSTTVEGLGAEGKVKVIFDCQQLAVRTIFEDGYFESASASAVTISLTIAMKDAYRKSKELMNQMTQKFYSELSGSNSEPPVSEITNNATGRTKSKSKIDRLKLSINQDLTSTTVEGTAENGKVKIIYDGRQRPVSLTIDESYFETAFLVEDVCDAVTAAMRDAYAKSAEKMDEKMKSLYTELGLAS
jgi:DNA-binding protein YbaB